MRTKVAPLAAAACLLACSTPASRIKKNQAAFDSYPPAVQESLRSGKVESGFTPEQVTIALGKPDRIYTKKTGTASQEIWAYGASGGPSMGFGLGMATGWPTVYGADVGIGTNLQPPYDQMRVVFENGKVVSVEKREK